MFSIHDTTPENIQEIGIGCITNPKHPGFQAKQKWFENQYREGWKIRVLYDNEDRKGFIEFGPAEKAWRPISAPGYIFIQCISIHSRKDRNKGYAGVLIQNVIEYAQKHHFNGVVVISSEGSWIAGKSIFLKQDFRKIASKGRFDLLYYPLAETEIPTFRKQDPDLSQPQYQGLQLYYADQCPYIMKTIAEFEKIATQHNLSLQITQLTTAEECQQSPCTYGIFCLLYNGKVYADHYISKTRFRNILAKEIGKH